MNEDMMPEGLVASPAGDPYEILQRIADMLAAIGVFPQNAPMEDFDMDDMNEMGGMGGMDYDTLMRHLGMGM